MKLYFDKLNVPSRTVEISFDGGNNFTTYNKSTLRSGSLDVPDDISSFSQIVIRGGGLEDTPWYEVSSPLNQPLSNKITKALLSNTVTSVTYGFFAGGSSGNSTLRVISFPSSTTTIQRSAFAASWSLENITIDEQNPNYSSEDGAVYNKDKTTFLCCPKGKSNINFAKTVTVIDGYAFQQCTHFTSIVIPSSVTSIGDWAFSYCTNLATINYLGTQEQWDAINKGSNWNKDCPADMKINVSTIHNIIIDERYFEVFNKPTEALSGSTVTLTGRPWDGFKAYWKVYDGNGQTILESYENTISFTMPAYDVYINAYGRD